jgi:hypothetical protein
MWILNGSESMCELCEYFYGSRVLNLMSRSKDNVNLHNNNIQRLTNMGKGKKTNKKSSRKIEPLPYDLQKFRKRSDQLSKRIYDLPLDIKMIIFRIAIDNHMDVWKSEHVAKMKRWCGDSSDWHIPYSTLDLVQGWGCQAPVPNYFNVFNASTFSGNIPRKFKVLPCNRKKVITEVDGERYICLRKADVFSTYDYETDDTIRGGFQDEILDRIRDRRTRSTERHNKRHNKRHKRWWVAKKCRCLTCDLVRLAHRQHASKYGPVFNNKYDRITYTGGSQWTARTVSQIETLSAKELKSLKKQRKLNRT